VQLSPVIDLDIPRSAGCHAGRCGASTGQAGLMSDEMRRKIAEHPCYSEQAHHHFARMHAAVAPACNIQCHYCNRKFDCANESRPGVVTEVLTPEQAVRKTLAVAAEIPQLSVVGIAGPGDPLANPEHTFATFRLLTEHAPDLKLCLSTNGLALPEHIDELCRHHIGHVTITINCVDPDIGARIYPWIIWQRRRVFGREAAAILIEQQQKGLELLVERGILVKVNSVMIPGVNDKHLLEVSRIVRGKGAFLHNVMPLISQPEHGTYYGLSGQRGPSPSELQALQDVCAGEMRVMRHCRQCRADAVGLLGEDRSAEFTLDKIDGLEIDYAAAMERRRLWRAQHAVEAAAKAATAPLSQALTWHRHTGSKKPAAAAPAVLIAVASKGGGIVNQHFGHAREFLIYEASADGVRMVGVRKTDVYCSGPAGCGELEDTHESVLERTLRTLQGCRVLLCAKIGFEPWGKLEAAGITPNSEHALEPIEEAVAAAWREIRERAGTETPLPDSGKKYA